MTAFQASLIGDRVRRGDSDRDIIVEMHRFGVLPLDSIGIHNALLQMDFVRRVASIAAEKEKAPRCAIPRGS